MNIEIHGLLTDRDCLIKVSEPMDGYLHQSWVVGDKVISYENIPVNYPAGSLCVWESLEKYFEAIRDVSWINEPEYILINHVDEDEHKVVFTFVEVYENAEV